MRARTILFLLAPTFALATLPALAKSGQRSADVAGTLVPDQFLPAVQEHVVGGRWSARRPATSGCPAIYMITTRTCPYCKAFTRDEFAKLDRLGYDVRLHLGSVTGERDGTIAVIALKRDVMTTIGHVLRTPVPGPARVNDNQELLDAYNAAVETTKTYARISRAAGNKGWLPGFLWRDGGGRWRITTGYEAKMMPGLIASLPKPPARCVA